MNLEGVAPIADMALAHAPVGARIVLVVDCAQRRLVVADVEAPQLTAGHHRLGHRQIPVELVGDAGLHGGKARQRHRGSGGA